MGSLFVTIGMRVCERDEIVLERVERSHSFVSNFANAIRASFSGAIQFGSMITTDGGSANAFCATGANSGDGMYGSRRDAGLGVLHGTSGVTSSGIVLGSGNSEFDTHNRDVNSKIPHGTSSGSLIYGATHIGSVVVADDESYIDLDVSRIFNNESGGEVIVSEVSLQGYAVHKLRGKSLTTTCDEAGEESAYFMWARDVLSSPIVVSDGQSVNVTIKIRTWM